MLIVDPVITPQLHTLPIHSGQSGKQNCFWMLVEIEGKVRSVAGYAGQPQGVSLDAGVLMDLELVPFLSASLQFLRRIVHISPIHA